MFPPLGTPAPAILLSYLLFSLVALPIGAGWVLLGATMPRWQEALPARPVARRLASLGRAARLIVDDTVKGPAYGVATYVSGSQVMGLALSEPSRAQTPQACGSGA